ncbi:MAG TPA: DUF4838 domain-containing protein [Armatimonadota bacterium]|nr:DUF4838 domain-containing protein [Armatimonadota bacterium]
MRYLLQGCAILLWMTMAAHAAPLPLVVEGRSQYAIYHAPDAPDTVKMAATELRDYIRQATGASLPISQQPREPMLSLGANAAARAAGLSTQGIPLEGFRIVTRGRNLFILGPDTAEGERTPGGGTSAGTRNGVYAFLEEYLGIRWLMPGPHGDYVPRATSVTVPEMDRTDAPFFLNRRVPYTQERRAEVKQWWARQRLGWSLTLSHGHNWHSIPPEAFDQHPDWFAEIGGKRIPPRGWYKLCVTNQGLIRAFAEGAIRRFDENPELTTYSLSPSDGGGWCQCAACQALYEKDPNGDLSVTPAILTFYNEVAKLVARKYPNKLLAGYVYANYVFPPSKPIRLEPNLFLVWAPSFDYGFTLYRPELQKQWDELVAQWRAVTDNISYYDLPNCVHNGAGAPNPPGLKILKFLYPRLKQAKMKGVYVYGNPAWGHSGPMNYILARLAWNPDADIDALFNEFCEKAYAEGAEEMKRFFHLLDAETERFFIANTKESYVLSEARMRDVYAKNFPEMERLYRAAMAKVRDAEAKARLEMLGLNLSVLHWNLRQRKMLPQATASTFHMEDAAFFALLRKHSDSLALAPSAMSARPAVVERPLSVQVPAKLAHPSPVTPFLFRGDQHLVLRPNGNEPVKVSFHSITTRGTLLHYALFAADGAEVTRGLVGPETPLVLENPASPYYHLYFSAGHATFGLAVEGAAWAANGHMSDQGLHFLGKVTPVYFEVPQGVASFQLSLGATPPGETAVATLYAPNGREVARFDCTTIPVDRKRITVPAGGAGFWKLVVEEAPTGVIDDVWILASPEIPGFFSLAPDQALSVRPH